ncbi:MAG: zf-HC2 domain-containing protein [Planctomycetes bacterium]|nr:zf-HC2 domain-containing protein [Planctomycetota bacterium]
MNCESLALLLNAALDGELSGAERAAMQQHLAECPPCQLEWQELQGLHHELSLAFPSPEIESSMDRVLHRIRATEIPGPVPINRKSDGRSNRNSYLALFAVVLTVLIAAGTFTQWSSASPHVGEIALVTGSIDFKPRDTKDWIPVDGSVRVTLPAHTRIRTRTASLCEIRTKSDAVVRLNSESELVMHQAEKVELVSGELWCRASSVAGIEICGVTPAEPQSKPNIFVCPSSTEMQWRALPNLELSCLDVAQSSAEIRLAETTCLIQPGQCVTFACGSPRPEQTHQANPSEATQWQLPLLLLHNPHDLDLQHRMTAMLAKVGQSKVAHLYEDQIRQLGPAGAIPLLAYVRSDQSRLDPPLRARAMNLVAEMATNDSVAALEELRHDDDPIIARMATRALNRLQPERRRFPPEFPDS